MTTSLIGFADVLQRTGESRSGAYRKMSDGRFPKQITAKGERPALWNSDEIDDYVAARIAARKPQT